jgi:hypothetical protein
MGCHGKGTLPFWLNPGFRKTTREQGAHIRRIYGLGTANLSRFLMPEKFWGNRLTFTRVCLRSFHQGTITLLRYAGVCLYTVVFANILS